MDDTITAPDWVCVNASADWQARDSMADYVYRDHLWILGGWFTPQTPNPLDVWKSPDGQQWTCVQEHGPWVQSDLPVALVFGDRMWLMGGRKLPGTECSNRVWSSADGVDWVLETEHAGWSPRVASSFAVFDERMWVLGGTGSFYDHSPGVVRHDVWSSANGRDWAEVTRTAPWSARAHGQALVFDHRLWILGGGLWHPEHVATNDVWSSADGVHWEQVCAAAPWAPRLWFTAVAYRGRMWVLGGWSREHGNFGDVWTSADGCHWTQVESRVIWTPRHEHSAYVFKDRIWIAGGYAEVLDSQVWSLALPLDWSWDR